MQIISEQYCLIRTDKSSNLFCKWHTLVSNTDGKRESSKGTRTRQLSRFCERKWQVADGRFRRLAGRQWLRSVVMVGIRVDHCSADRQLVSGTAGWCDSWINWLSCEPAGTATTGQCLTASLPLAPLAGVGCWHGNRRCRPKYRCCCVPVRRPRCLPVQSKPSSAYAGQHHQLQDGAGSSSIERISAVHWYKGKLLEAPSRGPSRSLIMSPFDRAHMTLLLTFYSNNGSILCRFWDIQSRIISWPWNPGQRSLKVIRKIGYGFLLVFYSNFVPYAPFLRYSTGK